MNTLNPTFDPEHLLAQAEQAVQAEDWDGAIALYRRVLEFDRAFHGAEAKLQWALRMKEIASLYQQGKEHLAAQRYADALTALRQARLLYAGHYKDTDQLIVEAQRAMQQSQWQARASAQKKGCFLTSALLLVALMTILVLMACATTPPTGGAANRAPVQRSEMYKSAPAMTIDVNKSYIATIKTAKGNIVAQLYPKDAPQHVNNFVFLARDGFYNNLTFHRVVPGFVIQGGDPLGNGTGGPGYGIPPEIKAKHTKGALAMARRAGPAQSTPSSGSQFYITLAPQPGLDGEYTVFGQVISGMDVVEKIAVGDVIQTITIEEK
jgi:cyclophilin family peptidyl-prolyl cis-trans isomerase